LDTKSKSFEDYKKTMDLRPTPQTILPTKKEILHTGMEILFNKRQKIGLK
jgi:hypothetical protein